MKLISGHKGGEFNLSNLYGFVLLIVLVGMLIGVGILTLDKFASTSYNTVKNINDTIVLTDVENDTAIAMDYGNITSVTAVRNGTTILDLIDSSCYIVNETHGLFYWTNVSTDSTEICDIVNQVYASYNYKEYDTATRDAVGSVSTEIAAIASDWLGLIVTVAILAIILGLVIIAFRPGMSRQ